MKKLLDSKFLFIIALSLLVLIVLGVGAFYLYRENDNAFVKSGYVLNPMNAKVEKYYFEKDTGYRENLSSMIEFKDVDKNDVTIIKESFLHYDDGGVSFLKNGAILDLDSINGKEAVKFYNITKDSIVDKKGNGYVIENANETIKLNNFIGRISDDKYIIVGNLEAKIPGNNSNIKGDYFEIVYNEEGIVNIENNNVKYQVTAEGTIIYIGNMAIDLGNKKITKDNEDVMSLTSITIDGNENIEIIPKEVKKEDEPGEGEGQGEGQGNEQGNQGQDGQNQGDGQGTGNDGTGAGDGDGQGGGAGEEDNKEGTSVKLKEATVGSTSVNVIFDMLNTKDDDNFTLKVTNLDTGRTIDMVKNVKTNEDIMVSLLSPKTKYLFTLVNEKDESKYFQKIFETNDFGIKLEKKYAKDDRLAFNVIVGEGTDITNAKLSLYKYNEETKKNEIVKTTYTDKDTGETKEIEKVVNLNSFDKLTGTHEIVFDMLDSNTIYTAVLDEFSVLSSNFKDIYNINLTTMTLKETPSFDSLTVNKDVGNGTFKLALSDIVDKDTAITKYTYLIYDKSDKTKTAIDPISRTNASAIEVKIGEKANELKNDTNYVYQVVIEYFDNEKYLEYITTDSINFLMGTEPYVTVVPNNDKISYDSIGATIYLIDNSCLIKMPGREKCDGESSVIVDVSRINAITGERSSVYTENVEFSIAENEVKYNLFVDKLQPGTTYTVEVRAVRDDLQTTDRVEIMHTEESKRNITTKTLSSFLNEWKDLESNATHVVNVSTKLIGEDGSGTLDPVASAESIKKVVVKLYAGDYIENLNLAPEIAKKEYINTEEFNIKENFYDNAFAITSDEAFGLDIDALREKDPSGNGKLSEYYTIAFYAYYDVTETNEVKLGNNVTTYKISPVLLMDNVETPLVHIDEITKRLGGIDTKLVNDSTAVGYKVSASFDRSGLIANHLTPSKINFYVYNDKGNRVSFYVLEDGHLKLVEKLTMDTGEDNYFEPKIYLDYGTEYGTSDTNMTRGNKYYIGYYLDLTSDDGNVKYPDNQNRIIKNNYGIYDSIISKKENPSVKMYVAKSTANSITYRYMINDPDKALYKESDANKYGFYYVVNDGEENKIEINNGENDAYSGEVTINGLSNNDVYSLYYKYNAYKTGEINNDILNYYDGENDGKRLFDGYYDATNSEYNFKYQVINNPLTDNKVVIKILAADNFIDRIVSYKVKFTDSKNNTLDKEIWNLVSCGDEEEKNRCFSVDYIELKNAGMKSENNRENMITVKIDALYDTGLMGYDYQVGSGLEYPYMIMEDNNTDTERGAYLSFSSRGQLTPWTDSINMPKGYYTYTLSENRISYKSVLNPSYSVSITHSLGYSGYNSNFGVLNPKMIAVNTMNSDNKTFSFSSITPKLDITKTTPIINGAVISMRLSGADIDDFCEESNGTNCVNTNNGDKYVYVETWANQEDVGDLSKTLIKRIRVKVDNNNTANELLAVVDKVTNGAKYYYQVYAYLNKNDRSVYTQLFDVGYTDKYEVKTYNFQALTADDIFKNFELTYEADSEGEYNDKLISTKINLTNYANNIDFNFDLTYAFCLENDETCGIGSEETNLFKRSIQSSELSTNIIDKQNISEMDLEFDKNYTIHLYAIYDVYDKENDQVVKKTLMLNRRNTVVRLNKLTVPDFVVSREAGYSGGTYYLDFNINVKDPSKVLENGKYFVNLLDTSGNVVGSLQVKENGSYVTIGTGNAYKEYEMDANVTNKAVRITGLDANTKYTIVVKSKAYVNNYSEEIPKAERNLNIEKSHTVYTTNSSGVAFGKDLLFSATERSIVVTFLGGSSLNNKVREINYTIGLWDNESSSSTFSGTYDLTTGDKKFEMYKDTEEWRFVIDPDGMINVLGQTYTVALSFKVYNSETGNIDYYDSVTNPEFAGRTQYVKDNR